MTAQEYPAQLAQVQIPADDLPGDAPEAANGVEAAPAGMPLLDPSAGTVADAVGNAMRVHDMNGQTAVGFGGHVGFPIPNMPDAQLPPDWNAALGQPEVTP